MRHTLTKRIEETHDYDLRLGRHIQHDDRSWDYNVTPGVRSSICAFLAARNVTESFAYWTRYGPILDQGRLGSCTGNAMTGLLGTEPFCKSASEGAHLDEDFAVNLYSKATLVDEYPGEYPPTDTGSSGLGVAKAAKTMGLIDSYRWAFNTSSLIYALRRGPVIVGVPWFESMFQPDKDGLVSARGNIVGGHEFLVRGYHRGVFFADNSWGLGWGTNGRFKFTTATWNTLRSNHADVTVPIPVKGK